MSKLSNLVFSFIIITLIFPASIVSAQNPFLRGLTPREWKPRGQMESEDHKIRARLRDLRLQEERRPGDVQAPPNEMRDVETKRPNTDKLSAGRERLGDYLFHGGGFSNIPLYNSGWGPVGENDVVDPSTSTITEEEPSAEWWEMNERSRSQRGGWFRSRYQSRQPGSPQSNQPGTIGPPTGGGGGMVSPGRNMPSGGGGHH